MSVATETVMAEVYEASNFAESARESLARAVDAMDRAIRLSGTAGFRTNQHEALLRFVIARQWGEMIMWRRALGDGDTGIPHPAGDAVVADIKAFMSGQGWLSPLEEIRAWFGGGR
jgi:hypothetical protein